LCVDAVSLQLVSVTDKLASALCSVFRDLLITITEIYGLIQ
jgi:hypothetical protein